MSMFLSKHFFFWRSHTPTCVNQFTKPYCLSFRTVATLVVQCVTGGIWKFPIQFVATEPNVDDVIEIEAAGLNKESVVGFRLSSQTR